jgi:hypothetical protein
VSPLRLTVRGDCRDAFPWLLMSAIIIPFKPRVDDAPAAAVPANGTAEILEFPARPHSLTAGDIAALEALAPTLNGVWTCEILVNDDGDEWAVFKAHHAPPLMFFVARSKGCLRLFNMEGEAVLTYAQMDAMTTMLGNAVGRRLVASV